MVILSLILYISLCQITDSQIYDTRNASKVFRFYIGKYNKKYKTDQEQQSALKNYVNTLNKINALNDHHRDVLYVPNGYADLNVEEFDNVYGVKVKPYYDSKKSEEVNALENTQTFDEDKALLYDLRKVDDLYKDFMKTYKKKNETKDVDRMAHYYRFLKTLVQINKYNFENNAEESIDKTADVLEHPTEYFY